MHWSTNNFNEPTPPEFRGRDRARPDERLMRSGRSVLLALALTLPATVTAAPYDVYTGIEAGYRSGDFDTATDESLASISAVIGAVGERAEVSVSIPYVVADSDTGGSDSGLGDIVLRAGYLLIEETDDTPSLRGSLAVKLPTANENEGLGTGETDVVGFITLSQPLTDTDSLDLSLGYIKTGNAPQTRYEDVFTYSAGVSRDFGRTHGFVSLEGRDNVDAAIDDPVELHVGALHALDGRHMLTGDVFLGLSDGAADIGVTFGVVRWF